MIPTRKDRRPNPRFDRPTYRRRNAAERCVGRIQESRLPGTRYEKPAADFLAVAQSAIIRRSLPLLDSPNRA